MCCRGRSKEELAREVKNYEEKFNTPFQVGGGGMLVRDGFCLFLVFWHVVDVIDEFVQLFFYLNDVTDVVDGLFHPLACSASAPMQVACRGSLPSILTLLTPLLPSSSGVHKQLHLVGASGVAAWFHLGLINPSPTYPAL